MTSNQDVKSFIADRSGDKPIRIIEMQQPDSKILRQNEDQLQIILKKNREDQLRLNEAWFSQLIDPDVLFREKMTFFWHDHFACRLRNAFLAQQQINTIRSHALGNFGDLLRAVSKDPGMLQFLNNQQNKKDNPNENFARELMELFTLGRGQYSEADIKNAARAFTGWTFNPITGAYLFRPGQHDFGAKTFRGKIGNFTGDDIINMILEEKQTAVFIANKICQFFVGSNIPPDLVLGLAEHFYSSNYNIEELLTIIYSSDWFYKTTFMANRIKSPVELIAGIQVHTGGVFNNPLNVIFLQKALGQILLQPPNVGGWPNGKEWIDSSSLTFRMSIPTLLLKNGESEFKAKDDGDANDVTNTLGKAAAISYSADWEQLSQLHIKGSSRETVNTLENYLLARPTSESNRKMITAFAGQSSSDPEFVKKLFIGFMSLPEYQLS